MQREIALTEVKRAPTRVADLQRTLSFALHNGYYELLLLHGWIFQNKSIWELDVERIKRPYTKESQ